MGLLDLLFGGKDSSSTARKVGLPAIPVSDLRISDTFAEIDSIGYYGECAISPSREWVLIWRDSDSEVTHAGHRKKGLGSYVLYNDHQKKVVFKGTIERPNGGHVANNGIFSLEDWHFGDDLSGTFYVFSHDGSVLIRQTLKANIYNSALSENGLLAACQTAIAPEPDGNRLTAFDVSSGTTIFSVHPETQWANAYEFSEQNRFVAVAIDGIGTFWYDSNGRFLNPEKYHQARLSCDKFNEILLAAEELLKKPDLTAEQAETALLAISRARTLGADADTGWKAKALKLQGLAYEFLNEKEKAILVFEEALSLNPKIGVKSKITKLRKSLGDES